MMRRVSMASLLFTLACTSAVGRGGSSVNEILKKAGGTEVDPARGGEDFFVVDTVKGTPERAFNAVRFTYEALGLEFSYYDPDRHELGGFITELHDLDGKPPSTWLDCGEGMVARNNADQYSINLTVATRVLALDATDSTVETVLRARSRQRDVWSSKTNCATLGTLEKRIADGARELLRKYGPGRP